MKAKDKQAKDKQFVQWAKSALHGLDDSAIFCGILDDHPLEASRMEFTLQLGHCILTNKPIIVSAPYGVDIPPKLVLVADKVVRFDPRRMETLGQNLTVAFTELGINKQ